MTTKAFYVNGLQVAPAKAYSVGAYSVTLDLLEIDWGRAERERFYRARPLRDGRYRRGARTGGRDVSFQLAALMSDAVPANRVEAVRDEFWSDFLADHVAPSDGLVELKQTREDTTGAAVARIIRGELVEYPSWVWMPDAVGPGLVGSHRGSIAVMPLTFECPFPWFEDGALNSSGPHTIDGTLRNTSITNNGLVPCGLKFTITGTGTGLTISVSNATSGASAIIGSGITMTGVAPTSGNVVVDWYATDPMGWSALEGSTSIRDTLNISANIGLVPGANTIQWQVTSGTLTGGQITIQYAQLWGNP